MLGVFIDLSKAFDTIDHSKLLSKLHNYGIRGNALELIKSYLSDRKQYVKVLDEESSELDVIYGIPQGSVLGPLLFLLYINNGLFVLFADDTNINIKKCCFMYFSPNKREMRNEGADEDDTILAIEGTIIKQVTETKFLGVTIDDKLSWKPNIEILNKKLKSLCGRIYRIKRALPEHLYISSYTTLCLNHI